MAREPRRPRLRSTARQPGRYWTIVSTHTMNDFQAGAVAAMLPYFVSEQHYTYAAAAGLTTASTALSAVSQPVFGGLSDRFGLRWFTLVGMLVAALGVALTGWTAGNYWVTWALIAIAGLGAAAFHPPASVAAKLTGGSPNRAMSTFATGGNLGMAIAPVGVGLTVGLLGLRATPLLLLPTFAIALLYLRVERRSRAAEASATARPSGAWGAGPGATAPAGEPEPADPGAGEGSAPLRATLEPEPEPEPAPGPAPAPGPTGGSTAIGLPVDLWRPFAVLLCAISLWSLSYIGTRSFIALRAIEVYGVDDNAGTLLLGVYSAAGALGTFCGGFLADRFGRLRVLPVGYLSSAALTLLFLVMPTFPLAVVVAGALGFCLFMPFSLHTTLSHTYLPRHLATASGATLGMSMTVGGLFTPVFGAIADRSSEPVNFWGFAGALVAGAGVLLTLRERRA